MTTTLTSFVRRLAPLVAASALYLAAAHALGVVRWDGLAPQPYRYVTPPPGVQNGGTPTSATKRLDLTPAGSSPDQLFTDDLQAQLLLPTGVFAGSSGGHVTITVTPSAPPAQNATSLAGNVYTVQALGDDGKAEVEPWKQTGDLYLRSAVLDTPAKLYVLIGGQPKEVAGSKYDQGSGMVVAKIDRGGPYVVGVVAGSRPSVLSSPVVGAVGAVVLVLVAAAISIIVSGSRRDDPRRNRRRRRG